MLKASAAVGAVESAQVTALFAPSTVASSPINLIHPVTPC